MIVTSDLLAGATTLWQAEFDKLMGKLTQDGLTVAMKIPAGNKSVVTFNWLGAPPTLRTFTGTVEFGKSFPHNYSVEVGEQAVGLAIKEREFRHNTLDTITRHVAMFQRQALRYIDKIIFTQLGAGFTANGYDAVTFYNDSHPVAAGGTYDNLLSGAGSTLLADDSNGNYAIAWALLNTTKDDQGEPSGFVASHVVVHPNNRVVAMKVFVAPTVAAGGTNVLAGDAKVIPSAYLPTSTQWHLLDCVEEMKPILLVEDLPIEFTQEAANATGQFLNKVLRWKVQAELATGFGPPWLAVGAAGA